MPGFELAASGHRLPASWLAACLGVCWVGAPGRIRTSFVPAMAAHASQVLGSLSLAGPMRSRPAGMAMTWPAASSPLIRTGNRPRRYSSRSLWRVQQMIVGAPARCALICVKVTRCRHGCGVDRAYTRRSWAADLPSLSAAAAADRSGTLRPGSRPRPGRRSRTASSGRGGAAW